MAAKVLDGTRPRGASLGLRVDDAVEERRARERKHAPLRAVPATAPAPGMAPKAAAPPALRAIRFKREPVPLAHATPHQGAPAPRVLTGPQRSAPGAAPRFIETDPTFDADVEQARKITTAVLPGPGEALSAPSTRTSSVSTGQQAPRLRLTLRGQRVLVALGFALSIALGAIAGTVIGVDPLPEGTSTMVVQSGDSLWSIASQVAGQGEDPRPMLEQIAELNGLQSPLIASGQTLVVPAESE